MMNKNRGRTDIINYDAGQLEIPGKPNNVTENLGPVVQNFVTLTLLLKPRLHLPRSSYDFSVCDFLYDLPFVDFHIQKRKAIVR